MPDSPALHLERAVPPPKGAHTRALSYHRIVDAVLGRCAHVANLPVVLSDDSPPLTSVTQNKAFSSLQRGTRANV